MDNPFSQRLETYLAESRYEKPKQVFQMLAEHMAEASDIPRAATFLDVGCATGELIFYLRRRFPQIRFTGIDNQPGLLARARSQPELEGVDFIQADALQYQGGPYDVVTCFGMLGIFDSFEPLLESLIANTRRGGRIFLQGLMNEDDIDVHVYYRDNRYSAEWQRGFNITSMARLSGWLGSRVQSSRFIPVQMEVDIPRRPDTPHRAYTVMMADGTRATINGLCLMLPEKIVEIIR